MPRTQTQTWTRLVEDSVLDSDVSGLELGLGLRLGGLDFNTAIYIWNCCPGSVTGVDWHGRSRDWCARGSRFDSGGNHSF